MGRPCEEVIVISDHEEGEITDSDLCPRTPSPANRFAARVPRGRDGSARRRAPRSKRRRAVVESSSSSSSSSSSPSPERRRRPIVSTAPKRPNATSLRSRLANMIAYENRNRRNRVDAIANIDGLENLTSGDDFSDPPKDRSDDDELLRELALKSKPPKRETPPETRPGTNVDDEIRELRLAALKSAVLKKASERKKTARERRKRRAKSDGSTLDVDAFANEYGYNGYMFNVADPLYPHENDSNDSDKTESNDVGRVDESDRDDESEHVLRSNLLASLKRTPRASSLRTPAAPHRITNDDRPASTSSIKLGDADTVASNLIVRLGDSDTESDGEATKNLTLMHKKLTEQTAFQRNLDVYLRGVRSCTSASVEQNELRPQTADKYNENIMSTVSKTPTKYNQQEYRRLLLRLHELQKSKRMREASLLLKNSTLTSLGISHRQILKPSILINGSSNYHWIKNQSRKDGQSQKVFDQQLVFIRKKIIDQSELIKKQKSEMQKLQMKKQLLLRQLKSINLLLNTTDKEITLNHQSRVLSSKQLSKLLRHQSILVNQQKRFSKTIQKASLENIPPMKISVTINNDNSQSINKENDKTESHTHEPDRFPDFAISISSLPDDDTREVHIKTNNENSDNHPSNSNNNLVNGLTDSCKENRINLVDSPENPDLSQSQIPVEQKDLQESEKCLNYAEYDSTLLGLKPSSRQVDWILKKYCNKVLTT